MSGGTKVLIGVVGAVLLLLILFSAFADGAAWPPQDAHGAGRNPNPAMGPHPMMGGSLAGSYNEDEPFDRQFIDRMIPHHAMAITSAQHMISDSPRPELRELADDIVGSQSQQIDQMRAWRGEWYGDPGPQYAYSGDGWSDGMRWDDNGIMGRGEGMMGRNATDIMFLRMMIPHHQQAVQVSRQALGSAEHPELRHLAEQIINQQSAEIELMRGYLQEME